MENRFSLKDFFLFALILILIVLVILSMVQFDRQWTKVLAIEQVSNDHTRDLVEIKRALAEGVRVNGDNTSPTTAPSGLAGVDPFKPIKDAEAMSGFSRGDWLVENFGAKLKAITPFVAGDVPAAQIQVKVQECLLYRDVDTLDYVPLLAKSWTISPDGLTFTFNLRRGVTFSDGEPFTADDVVFTFDWILNPAVNAPRERSFFDQLESVKKLDDFTVEFKFKKFYFASLGAVGGETILPKHFYSKYAPETFNQSPGLLMGTGPYRLADPAGWKPGMKMELFRNERYWGTPPTFDRLVYLEVEEETAEQTMFTNAEMDVFAATAEQYDKMKIDPKVLARAVPMEYVSLLSGYSYIGWNETAGDKPSRFADKRVRQAMSMLIDREAIAKQIFLGYASPASGTFAPGSNQHDPSVKPWPFDPERAKKLLADCGYVDRDGDGVIDAPDGTPFKFKLTMPNKSAVYTRVALFVRDNLAKAGIVMELEPMEWPLLQERLTHRDFDAITLAWSGSIDDDPYQIFHSSQIEGDGDNRISYKNPELDAALVAARTCVDEKQRTELWHKVDRILAEDCPYTFMLNRKSTIFYDKRLQNIRTSAIGTNYNRLDCSPLAWFVPKGEQKYSK